MFPSPRSGHLSVLSMWGILNVKWPSIVLLGTFAVPQVSSFIKAFQSTLSQALDKGFITRAACPSWSVQSVAIPFPHRCNAFIKLRTCVLATIAVVETDLFQRENTMYAYSHTTTLAEAHILFVSLKRGCKCGCSWIHS
jgi:hypothetical protein